MLMDFFILLKQELVIVAIIFLLLFIKLGKDRTNESLLPLINVVLLLNLLLGFFGSKEGNLFGEMFHTGKLIILEKNILNLATWIISLLSFSWLRTHKHVIEFYILLLTALLGMFFMISSGNLLVLYLGLEMSTIPIAAAANFDLAKRKSSEAAMKMIISSAFSSALVLLGISWIYGVSGSLDFSVILLQGPDSPFRIFAFILLVSGFAFKMSAVPFHLWTADVYEGAPVSVTAYLSVVSKASVVFVILAFLYNAGKAFADTWYHILIVLSILSIIIGNLFALRQNNFKRFLAFSSIAQVGFILIGIAGSSQVSSAAVVYFVLVYVFSNLAAFGVVALVSAVSGKENISDYKAFYTTNPLLSWVLTIAMFSLAGVPPTAGFFGKFFLLMAGAAKGNYWLIGIAALNMVVSFYYYLRVVKAIFMEENPQPIEKLAIPGASRLALYICLAGMLIAGLASCVYDYIYSISFGL